MNKPNNIIGGDLDKPDNTGGEERNTEEEKQALVGDPDDVDNARGSNLDEDGGGHGVMEEAKQPFIDDLHDDAEKEKQRQRDVILDIKKMRQAQKIKPLT
jgi:hypothetical protein